MTVQRDQFDIYTAHLTNQSEIEGLWTYINRIPGDGLSFNTTVDGYILVPNPSPDTTFEPGYPAEFRWGNWVGAGTGAGRFSDHSDFTAAEELVAAKDVFDAIGRVHDLSIRDAKQILNPILDSNGPYLAKLIAVRAFVTERVNIDADFITATRALGVRDGLIGYEADIRELL